MNINVIVGCILIFIVLFVLLWFLLDIILGDIVSGMASKDDIKSRKATDNLKRMFPYLYISVLKYTCLKIREADKDYIESYLKSIIDHKEKNK